MEQRKRPFRKVVSDLLVDFSNNTSIQGVKFIGESHRHWTERVFWLIIFIISLIVSTWMIHDAYVKWQQSPVIVSFAQTSTPIWQIPFPAVTICPETKTKKTLVDITEGYRASSMGDYDNMTVDQLRNLEALSQICDAHLFDRAEINSGLQSEEIVPLLKSISLTLDDVSLFCKWTQSLGSCEKFFTQVMTEEGVCFTFNGLSFGEMYRDVLADNYKYESHNETSDFWSLENGYTTKNAKTYPNRVIGPGQKAGLTIVLKLAEPDFDYICRGPVQGFKVILHTPGEVPRVSKQYFRVPLRQHIVVSVKPNMLTTSDDLIDYSPEKRQCFFEKDRSLKFFKTYTQSNCETECLANYTLKTCGCVKFSMPRNNDTRICNQTEVKCYTDAEYEQMADELSESLESESTADVGTEMRGKTACYCLPACTSLNYDTEISQADYDYEKVFEAYGADMNELPGAILASLTIFFKEAQFITSKRSELYGLVDFVANCGGLLGLFIGVSILSCVEIVYYATLRLACDMKNRRQAGSKESSLIDLTQNGETKVE